MRSWHEIMDDDKSTKSHPRLLSFSIVSIEGNEGNET
jgi:hypothetical protein